MNHEAVVRAPELADWAMSQGRGALTTPEIAELLGVEPDQVRRRLHAPVRRGEWVQPTRGLWMPVPPEFRTWGAPPGIEIIDLMLRHLEVGYYVGWLSAAALHGASHQAPQVFQVAVDRHVRDRSVGRTRFSFAQRNVEAVPIVFHPTRDGAAQVSTVAATMLDVADDLHRAAGLDNAATVIVELAEDPAFDPADLVRLATGFPAAATRRVGWILSRFADREDLAALRGVASELAASPSHLDPHSSVRGPVDDDWMLMINRDVEPDT